MTQGLHSLNGRLAAANNVCRRPWEPLPLRWQRRRSFQLSRSFRGVGTETSEDSLLSSSKKANKPAAFYPPHAPPPPANGPRQLPCTLVSGRAPELEARNLSASQAGRLSLHGAADSVPCTWVDGFQASEVQRGEQQKDGGCLASQQSWV